MASHLLRISHLFDYFGSPDSGFYMTMGGFNDAGQRRNIVFDLIARQGDGSYIPAIPAILIVKKLVAGEIDQSGAYPCMGFVSLGEYVAALAKLNIQWRTCR